MKFPQFLGRLAAPDRSRMANNTSEKKGMSGFLSFAHAASAKWSERNYPSLAREGYMRNPVAHRAIRLIAEAAASVPWLLSVGDRELCDHPALSLLLRPNARISGIEFFETLFGHLLLSGNAYVAPALIGEQIRELHLLRPDRMRVMVGGDGWPSGYEYRVGSMVKRYPVTHHQPALLHVKTFHPLDDHLGFAALESAQMALDLSNAAMAWNKALIDNSARPSGALVYQPKEGGNLSPDQYERLKSELTEGYSGPARAGRPMLLEGGLDWKSMGLSPKEMDFAEARNGAARDIALAFGVPPMLIGIPGDNTYSNYQEANRAFYRLTVLPLLNRTAAAFSQWLSSAFDEDLRFSHDLDQVPGLVAERDQLWARVNGATFLSDAEKREAVGYKAL